MEFLTEGLKSYLRLESTSTGIGDSKDYCGLQSAVLLNVSSPSKDRGLSDRKAVEFFQKVFQNVSKNQVLHYGHSLKLAGT